MVYVLTVSLSGLESQFDITRLSYVTTQGIPYDFKSVMHYGAYAFSIDRSRLPTIEPLDSSIPLSELGQREGFSPSDIVHVNTLYCGGGTRKYQCTGSLYATRLSVAKLAVQWSVYNSLHYNYSKLINRIGVCVFSNIELYIRDF